MALGELDAAEATFRAAIEQGARAPAVVDSYVALATLYHRQGREADARQALDQARRVLPNSPRLHRALGELALSRGWHAAALDDFRTALKLAPDDVDAAFQLGITLRRARQFRAAQRAFDQVAEVDRDYPGLALQRGLLLEAIGRTEEALKAYAGALAPAPDDPDLRLQLGCAQAAEGRAEQGVDLLRAVHAVRPQSAQANHCLGRALLAEKSLAEALERLERAVNLDPHRPEYYLALGWAANEAGDGRKAADSLQHALSLDQGMGDAYWQRGILAFRQGRFTDAVEDLRRTLQLRPSRYQAHAALAEAYHELGMDRDAIAEWRLASAAHPEDARWRFRLGRLLSAHNYRQDARTELAIALELAENQKQQPRPRWIWEAHRLLGRAIGLHQDAVRHWEAFLRGGPEESPYRNEAKFALAQLGKPWAGE
jgi:tetratricopeptide (TPR) repeat protein